MYTRETELFHHGVKGQQWGVKNGPPYPLSEKQKKKVSKKYAKLISKTTKEVNRNGSPANVAKVTNDAVGGSNQIKNKKAAQFNKETEAAYKKDSDYYSTDEYAQKYVDTWNQVYDEVAENLLYAGFQNSEHYKQAVDFAKQYDMESWSDVVQSNNKLIKELKDKVKKNFD